LHQNEEGKKRKLEKERKEGRGGKISCCLETTPKEKETKA
jgi:hypothetical protein